MTGVLIFDHPNLVLAFKDIQQTRKDCFKLTIIRYWSSQIQQSNLQATFRKRKTNRWNRIYADT
ncbi:Uncharacterized protein APZ42_027987 [Daphnia magna]|uniref:Uncharacterized protein n=1 Tax=Daphnia magna TaxID=35525 RepID=A0A164QX38_9CRUS|nr:Uncharacterized protein APZ42_027987 [Daphnia magna]